MTRRLALLILGLFALRLAAYWLVDGLHPTFAQDYCLWDCEWYLDIADNGYQLGPKTGSPATYGQANWAFFPLFPLLVRSVAWLLPVSQFVAGFMVANFFLLLFVVMAVVYLPSRRPAANPAALAAFLFAFPDSLYFSLTYTESLFAFLATAGLYCLSANRLVSSAGFSALMSATRVSGILFAPVVALRASTPATLAWRSGDRRLALTRAAGAALPIALAPLGLVLFMAYLHVHMGDGLAFAHVEKAWGRHYASPIATLYNNRFRLEWKGGKIIAVDEYASLIGLILCARLAVLRLWPETWLLAGTILMGLSAGLFSMQRYVFANPVFMIFLFDWLWQSTWFRRAFPIVVVGCAALQLYFAHCWLDQDVFLI